MSNLTHLQDRKTKVELMSRILEKNLCQIRKNHSGFTTRVKWIRSNFQVCFKNAIHQSINASTDDESRNTSWTCLWQRWCWLWRGVAWVWGAPWASPHRSRCRQTGATSCSRSPVLYYRHTISQNVMQRSRYGEKLLIKITNL